MLDAAATKPATMAFEDSTVADAVKRGNPVIFFDIGIDGESAGRIKVELFKNIAPRVRALLICHSHMTMARRLWKTSEHCVPESIEKVVCRLVTRDASSIA